MSTAKSVLKTSKTLQSISFVMPVLNEERYLRAAVESILQQSVPGAVEVVLALGPSVDGTNAIARELVSQHKVVQLVDNPKGSTSAALNVAIAAAKHDVVIRVDAHSKLSSGYAELAVRVLNETGADNVGGIMHAVGETAFQSAVAWAYMSRVGLGGGAFHVGGEAGPADSVYLGVFRRTKLVELGGFDEHIIRGQDWELNLRIRESGGVVWFDPRLEVAYHPRSSWAKLASQFFDTGLWRGQLTRKNLRQTGLRYFAPPALVLGTFAGLALYISGWPVGLIPVAGYFGLIGLAVAAARGVSIGSRLWLLAVLPTMHFAWGAGFLAGLFRR